jgi:ATP-dependent RNA helicase RhlE
MNFDTFNFDDKIKTGIKALGYSVPTPIQKQGMPPILEGRDVMGTAQTGTGKTAAFVLPILQSMMNKARGNVRALIIAPTRELTEQTNQVVQGLGRHTQHRGMSIYGGVSIQPQIQKLRSGVDIVSACPGRLLDHVERGTINLATVEVLVLDEADQMFDMGFLPDIRKIIKRLPKERQTLLFSATMPREIQTLARDILSDPVTIQIGHAAPASTVTQAFYAVESEGKTTLLKNILSDNGASSVLVFTRTKHRAKSLAQQLERTGFEATSLHGNLSQMKRQQALDGFRKGTYRVLVATDIAARGIDVADISHVINYDMPDTAEAYTHRVGRTGRAEKTGESCSFVTRDDKDLVRCLERSLGAKLQLQKTETTATPAYAHLQPPASRSPRQQPPRRAPRPEQKPAYRAAQKQQTSRRPEKKEAPLPRERTAGKPKKGFMNSARRVFGFASSTR